MTQTPPSSTPIWRDMDQKALDDAYDQDVYAPNRPLIVTRRIAASDRARAILGSPERVAYGPSEYERLDIFRAAEANAPINVFVHGGAWRRNKGPDYHLQAEPLVACRRALPDRRFHQRGTVGRRFVSDVRAGAPRHRLGLA